MRDSNSLIIEHQCPQCGAPVTLHDSDRLFACRYCRVHLYLTSRDYFRYLLPHADGAPEALIYAPYWHLKGMGFFRQGLQVGHRIVNVNVRACRLPFLWETLGLRPQTLKLRFVSPEIEARCLPVGLPPRKAARMGMGLMRQSALSRSSQALLDNTFIGETVSLVYAPLFVRDGMLHDAVLQEPVQSLSREEQRELEEQGQPLDWRVEFIPALCPHCGWDLEGERDSLVLFCRHCGSAWISSPGKKLVRIPFATASGDSHAAVHLPFWCLDAQVEAPDLCSHADLFKLLNLPKALKQDRRDKGFHFWLPAFKIRPAVFLRLAKIMVLSQPGEHLGQKLPTGNGLYPVTLNLSEAQEGLKILLAHMGVARRLVLPNLDALRFKINKLALVYFPFRQRGHELYHPSILLSINRNTLRFGRNL